MNNTNFNKKKICDNSKLWMWFVLPSFIGCVFFIFIPSIASFLLSFTNWNLLNSINFCAFDNYLELFNEREFWQIFFNTVYYAVCVTLFATIIPLVLSDLLYKKIKGSEFFKTVYFIPFITPMIVVAMIWQWIFDPNIGLVNIILKSNIQWLYDKSYAMPVLIFISVWKLVGYNIIIFLSGYSGINSQIYEAAKIDGAGYVKTFFNITLPMLSPTIFFVLLVTTISSFQVFDLIYLMTQGGPENTTNILVYWLYKNAFEFFNIGKASAIAYILFIIIFILALIQWKLRTKWVITEKD